MAKEKNKVIKKAETVWEYLTGEEEARRLEELEEKWESDWNSSVRWEREDENNKTKKEIAKEMKKEGIQIDLISKITKLTKEEIEGL